MMSQNMILFITLSATAVFMTSANVLGSPSMRATATDSDCKAAGLSCLDCSTVIMCNEQSDGSFTAFGFSCKDEESCGVSAGSASCFSADASEAEACSCAACVDEIMADPYDPTKYKMCLKNGTSYGITCPSGETFDPDTNACGTTTTAKTTTTAAPFKCTEVGFHATDETCESYVSCVPNADGTIVAASQETCPSGQKFDTNSDKCVDSADLLPAEFTCPAGTSGTFPYPGDCAALVICIDGAMLGNPMCCDDGVFYDQVDGGCVLTEAPASCQVNSCVASEVTTLPCTAAPTTTTVASTAAP